MRTWIILLAAMTLTACVSVREQQTLRLLGGYRDPADQCQRVGETAATNAFLDDSADLVGCPAGAENIGVFVTETRAVEVGQVGRYVLFSVPRR